MKTLVLMSVLSMYQLSEAKECTNLSSDQTTFDVHYWNFYPFTASNKSNDNQAPGMFDSITYKLSRNTNLSLNWVKPEITYGEILDMPNTGSKNDIAVPILIDMDDKNPCLVKVYKSSGYAFLVRRDVKKPLSQLGGSFINGGQVIGLILILTGIAGICIWCLDRRRNPDNFPTPFIPGAWNGFWWAFVTMSTVGYGDLAPKSVPARLFSVLWMLLGLVAFSVLTANFTSSLAREIETDLNLFNKKIAVFRGGIERKAVIASGGKYNAVYNNLPDMMSALKHDKEIQGVLIDKHAAVSIRAIHTGKESKLIEIGKMIDFNHFIGMRLIMPDVSMCAAVKQCIERQVETSDFQETIFGSLSNSTMANDELEYTGSLFEDVEFFFILIAVFGVMTGVGVLWEYFWYKPKMLKAVKNNTEDIPKYILTDEEVQNLCENCCCRVEAIYQKDGQERKERLEADQSDSSISKLDNLIPLRRAKNLPKKDHV